MCLCFFHPRYGEDGHTVGEAEFQPPNPIRLQWDIPNEVGAVLSTSTRHNSKTACMCEKFHQLLAVGRWFPPGTPVSSTRKKRISSSPFYRLDMTLAVAEALNPNKPNQTRTAELLPYKLTIHQINTFPLRKCRSRQ